MPIATPSTLFALTTRLLIGGITRGGTARGEVTRRGTDDPLAGGEVTRLVAPPEKEASRECKLAVGVLAPLDCTPVANAAARGDCP